MQRSQEMEVTKRMTNMIFSLDDYIPRIPLGEWVEAFINFLKQFTFVTDSIRFSIASTVNVLEFIFLLLPAWLFIVLMIALTYWLTKSWKLPLFTFLGLFLVWNIGLWEQMNLTIALVLTATIVSIVIGVPVGILAARKIIIERVVTPILDFMQTMPAFVYLLPAVFFFSHGTVPGVIASVIFAMPPTIRLTILGIKQVPTEIIEASDSFGSTPNQKLFKVQLPLAKKTIMAGINQTIMLALSMVVIASLIGAKGLGDNITTALSRNQIGNGFEAGIAIVILAILLDRITQAISAKAR